MYSNPIIIVEDDEDDCEMLMLAFKAIGICNEVRCFSTPLPALAYLKITRESPAVIVSDINMPKMDGLSFKRCINGDKALEAV